MKDQTTLNSFSFNPNFSKFPLRIVKNIFETSKDLAKMGQNWAAQLKLGELATQIVYFHIFIKKSAVCLLHFLAIAYELIDVFLTEFEISFSCFV